MSGRCRKRVRIIRASAILRLLVVHIRLDGRIYVFKVNSRLFACRTFHGEFEHDRVLCGDMCEGVGGHALDLLLFGDGHSDLEILSTGSAETEKISKIK